MKNTFFAAARLGLAMLTLTGTTFAVSIFNDTFPETGPDAEPLGLGLTNGTLDLLKWDIVSGSVDVLDSFQSVNCGSPSGKRCVDINGSSGVTGHIQTTQQFNFQVGRLYTLTLWVSGSQRSGSDSMRVSIGSLGFLDITMAAAQGGQIFAVGQFAGNGSTGRIVINSGASGPDPDNIGLVFDDVDLQETLGDPGQPPEPATFVLIGSGIIAIALRRRK